MEMVEPVRRRVAAAPPTAAEPVVGVVGVPVGVGDDLRTPLAELPQRQAARRLQQLAFRGRVRGRGLCDRLGLRGRQPPRSRRLRRRGECREPAGGLHLPAHSGGRGADQPSHVSLGRRRRRGLARIGLDQARGKETLHRRRHRLDRRDISQRPLTIVGGEERRVEPGRDETHRASRQRHIVRAHDLRQLPTPPSTSHGSHSRRATKPVRSP